MELVPKNILHIIACLLHFNSVAIDMVKIQLLDIFNYLVYYLGPEITSQAIAASPTTTASGEQGNFFNIIQYSIRAIIIYLELDFTLKSMTLLKADPPLRLIEVLASEWKKAADLLGMNHYRVDIIMKDHGQSAEDCCRALINHWLYDVHGNYSYERSWKGMCDLLNDMKLCSVAKQLQKYLSKD